MATYIEFGGGPSDAQRTHFIRTKYGAPMSGYTGHIKQNKFHQGMRFGRLTHELAETYDFDHLAAGFDAICNPPPPANRYKHRLPEAPGYDRKYIKDMKSGYSGFVPRNQYVGLGAVFPTSCNRSIDDHMTLNEHETRKQQDLLATTRAFPQLQTLNHDPEVRDHIDSFRDTHPLQPILAGHRRCPREAPKIGYTGVIPLFNVTDHGIGVYFRKGGTDSLNAFYDHICTHADIIQRPVYVQKCPSSIPEPAVPPITRVYLQDGMIPCYASEVPLERFHFGKTIGNLTRELDCCAHGMPNYGAFTKYKTASKPPQAEVVF